MSGQKLLGIPISVQHTQAEKNRLANATPPAPPKNQTGPMRLYVGSLHFNITEEMLRGIFEPFGKIDSIQLIMDTETGRSKGYGFITVSETFIYNIYIWQALDLDYNHQFIIEGMKCARSILVSSLVWQFVCSK